MKGVRKRYWATRMDPPTCERERALLKMLSPAEKLAACLEAGRRKMERRLSETEKKEDTPMRSP